MNFLTLIDYIGTFAFAISGIRLASAKRFDWFGAYVVGFVTAVGGGTIRDLLLDVTPFWMLQSSYLIVTALALGFVILFGRYVIRLNKYFLYFRCHRFRVIRRCRYREKHHLWLPHVGRIDYGYSHRSRRRSFAGYPDQ